MIAQDMDQKLLRQYAGAGSNNQIADFTTFTEPRDSARIEDSIGTT